MTSELKPGQIVTEKLETVSGNGGGTTYVVFDIKKDGVFAVKNPKPYTPDMNDSNTVARVESVPSFGA